APAAATAEDVAEDVAENIAEITRALSGALLVDPRMTRLVIASPLLTVREHLESLVGFLELFFRLVVPVITIRLVVHGNATVRFFDVSFGGIAGDPQHFVIITFRHNLLL